MSHLLHLLLRYKVQDTQSRLRVLSSKVARLITDIPDNRFGFEMEALIRLLQFGHKPEEVSIQTIYYRNNAATRFRPHKDSGQVSWASIKSVVDKK